MFDWDQETLAFQMKGIIQNHDLILIGHRATDAMGFYFGPYFEYLFVPFYYLSRLHPFGVIPLIVFINILFVCLALFVVGRIFGKNIVLGFLFLWAVNPLIIIYDITVWAPLVIPLGYLLTLLILWRIYSKTSVSNFVLLGLVLGFFTQIHSLFFFMDLFVALFLLGMTVQKKISIPVLLRRLPAITIPVLVFFSPLVLFDIRHDYLNLRLFFGYFSRRAVGVVKLGESLDVLANFFKPLTVVNMQWGIVLFYIAIFVLLVYLIRSKKDFRKLFYSVTLCLWILTAVILLRLTQRPSEYYFLYLYPLITIALLDFFLRVHRVVAVGFCVLFFAANILTLHKQIQPAIRGLYTKDQIAQTIKRKVGTQPYSIAYDMPAGLNNGYGYLLDWHGIKPSENEKDPLIILRIPACKGDVVVDTIGIRIPDELTRQN